jgi:hypothetical protein
LTSLIVAGIGVLGKLAIADALRSGGSSATSATPASATTSLSVQQEVVPTPIPSVEQEVVVPSDFTQKQEIELIGNEWALLFAAGPLGAACRYETQPLCERTVCERVGGVKIKNCKPPTSGLRNSFFGATVQDIEIRGHRAAARFSNGELIEFWGDGGTWMIDKLGDNAGRRFFE